MKLTPKQSNQFQNRLEYQVTAWPKLAGWILIFLLFLPKFNLIEIGGSRAGIRIDDILLAFLTIYAFFLNSGVFLKYLFERQNKILLWFVGLTVFGAIFSGGNILFSLRMVEYLMIYVIARMTISPNWFKYIIGSYLCVNLVVCVLQFFGVLGGFTLEYGYMHLSDRFIGLTNGPWELGALVALGVCALIFPFKDVKIRTLAFWALVAGCLMIFSGARTPAASFVVLIGYVLVRLLMKGRIVLVSSLVFVAACVYIFSPYLEDLGISLNSRATTTLKHGGNFEYFVESMKNLDLNSVNDNYYRNDAAVASAGLDVSLNQRIFIIELLVSSYVNSNLLKQIFGLGLGYFGPSTDVGWLRIFVETGIVGFFIFIYYLYRVARSGSSEVCATLVAMLVINMITLDAFIGYKVMFVYYLAMAWGVTCENVREVAHPKVFVTR